MGVRRRSVLMIVLAAALSCAAPREESIESQLTAAEREEVQGAFDDAACYCEYSLLGASLITPAAGVCDGDPQLEAYAEFHSAGTEGSRTPCTALSDRAPRGRVLSGPTVPRALSGCMDAFSIPAFPPDALSDLFSYAPGPCRADFNHCLGSELRLKADSLARAPSSQAVRDAILDMSRVRFARAGLEYAASFNNLAPRCASASERASDDVLDAFCRRLEGGYGTAASQRMGESITQLDEVLRDRIDSELARSDARTSLPGTSPDEIWGPSSARLAAASLVAGRAFLAAAPPSGTPAGFDTVVIAAPRSGDVPHAAEPSRDDHVRAALDLITARRGLVPHATCMRGATVVASTWVTVDLAAFATATYHDLDRKLQRDSGRSDLYEPRSLAPLPLELSLMRRQYDLTPETIRQALALVLDLRDGADLDYSLVPDYRFSNSGGVQCYIDAIRTFRVGSRDPRIAYSAFARAGEGALPATGTELPPTPPLCEPTGPGARTHWYGYSAQQIDNVGAAGTAQIMRWQLLALTTRTPAVPWLDASALGAAVQSLDAFVGDTWTEYRQVGALRRNGEWTIVGLDIPATTPVLATTSADEIYCRRHGHYPASSVVGCPGGIAVVQRLAEVGRGTRFGRPFVRYRLGNAALPITSRLYIFSESPPNDDGTPAEATLLDVVHPGAGPQVHAAGGTFGELFQRILETDLADPAMPAANSMGLPNRLVPPLENELIDDGDAFEDSFRHYLTSASDATSTAAAAVAAARRQELDLLLASDAAGLDARDIELSFDAARAELCGAGPCNVPRTAETTLEDLGLVEVPGAPTSVLCEPFLADLPDRFRAFFPREHMPDPASADAFIQRELTSGLYCARFIAARALGRAPLRDVPTPVIDQLVAGGDGTFPDYGGGVRAEMIDQFRRIDDMLRAYRDLDAHYESAAVLVRALGDEVERLAGGDVEEAWCVYQKVSTGAAYMVQGVGNIVQGAASFGGGGQGGGAAATGAAGGAMSQIGQGATQVHTGLDHVTSIDGCFDGDRAATLQALRGFVEIHRTILEIRRAEDAVAQMLAAVAVSTNRLDVVVRHAQISEARREIARSRVGLETGVFDPGRRVLDSVERRRARDAVRRAQRFSFIATRAVEFRLASRFGRLTEAEPFVEAPSTWVNDVFIAPYHVEGPPASAVGAPDIALADYLRRLDDMVEGYSFARPFSEGRDVQVLNLSSLADGLDGPTEADPVPFWMRLHYMCRDAEAPILGGGVIEGDATAPCDHLGGVEWARWVCPPS